MTSPLPPWDDIPDHDFLPEGNYTLTFESMEKSETSGNGKLSQGCLMYKAQFRVEEPEEYAGRLLYDQFVIGTDDDQGALDPATWKASIGAKLLKKFFRSTGQPVTGSVDEIVEQITEQRVMAHVTTRTWNESVFNNIKKYLLLGQVAPGIGGNGGVLTSAAPPPSAPPPPAATAKKSGGKKKKPAAKKAAAGPSLPCNFCEPAKLVLVSEMTSHLEQHAHEDEE
jgi:hypothetical protein